MIHLAIEHPAQKASVIFGIPDRRKRLLKSIIDFFAFANDDHYKRAVPAGRSGGSAFSEPKYMTINIISLQQHVYGHSRSPIKISKALYTELLDRWFLDQKYQPLVTSKQGRKERESQVESKRVDVFVLRHARPKAQPNIRKQRIMTTLPSNTAMIQIHHWQLLDTVLWVFWLNPYRLGR